MLHTVRWAAERGLRTYEFLGGREPWTDRWTEEIRPCVEVQVYPVSPWTPIAGAAAGGRLASRVVRQRTAHGRTADASQ